MPLRLEVGPRDVAAGQGVLVRRLDRAKETLPLEAIAAELPGRLAAYQSDVFRRALDFRAANTHHVDTWDDLVSVVADQGGFVWAHWCGSSGCEARVSSETGASIRNIPFESLDEAGRCVVDGQPSERRVVFAKAY